MNPSEMYSTIAAYGGRYCPQLVLRHLFHKTRILPWKQPYS